MPQGRFADRLVAYARNHERDSLLVVVPRLSATLGCPPIGLVWEDTAIALPAAAAGWRDVLTGRQCPANARLGLADLFSELPLAVLWSGRSP
jgi:(1->4)-alpha-D-glucan 1-alpha-D-glucosylmutase